MMCLLGISPQKTEILRKEIQVVSWKDLIYYFPYKYTDRSRIFKIQEIYGNMPYVQLKGKIREYKTVERKSVQRLTAIFYDDTGSVELVWFRMLKQIPKLYKPNTEYILFGKPTIYGHCVNIVHPELETEKSFYDGEIGIQGQYNTTERMKNAFLHSRAIRKIIIQIFKNLPTPLPETLTKTIINQANVISLYDALRNIHFPKSTDLLQKAQYRLKFEELFYLQLHILRVTKYREKRLGGWSFAKVGNYFNRFYKDNLPFELTNAQKRVIREIRQDTNTGRQMNRLLQGDVGSGKTLVALLSLLLALDNGFQGAIMVPTEILAAQHYEIISQLTTNLSIEVALLTGSIRKKQRETILSRVRSGEIQIVIGTHVLINDSVAFSNLGLVVVDEQHRFGVAQRAKLWKKNSVPPHMLVMTATPIPRTLAMTIYGDLDVSVINELPPGRKPVKTFHVYSERRKNLYESVRKQLQQERQVYIVYPLIEESESIDLKNLIEGFETIKKIYSEYKVCMVHGKMKQADKETEMKRFVSGETQIMVATTVIEVGVNVPNASVIIIENAERFGLSQLHQLRGRVGRATEQSFCILVTRYKLTESTRRRIDIMTKTNDGFLIAEEDLKLRGPGNIDGIQQSGTAFNLKIANLSHDGQILTLARDLADNVLNDDFLLEKPHNRILKQQLKKLNERNHTEWFMIS